MFGVKASWRQLSEKLVDPDDRSVVAFVGEELVGSNGRRFSFEKGQPVLLPAEGLVAGGWVFPRVVPLDPGRPKPEQRLRSAVLGLKRWFRRTSGRGGESSDLIELLNVSGQSDRPLILIVGGATAGDGVDQLIDHTGIDVAAFDVYATSETTFVADAHRIPLADGSVSAVWVQAVLEHVYRPDLVVREIHRVLETNGLVYAETPFLQPVHEGAYDFLRFTPSGHRLLFAGFEEIKSGPLGGPGAALTLAVRGVAGGISRSRQVARLTYMVVQPLSLLDRFVPRAWRWDFATGCSFLGRKSSGQLLGFDPVATYEGAG